MKTPFHRLPRFAAPLLAALCLAPLSLIPAAKAADHADSPTSANDQAADIADIFFFLDPGDNTKAVLIMTFHGFIVPGEAISFTTFDPNVRYSFLIENTGDAAPDASISVRFSPKTSTTVPQIATITLPGGQILHAPATVSTESATAPTPTVTNDPTTDVDFFAGEVDDPFFFDLVAFNRFVASVQAGAPDATQFSRGRDTFAGYNVLSIAMRMPVAMLKGSAGNVVGLSGKTERRGLRVLAAGESGSDQYYQVDRMGNPAVNVALIPFIRKDEYNASQPTDDAAGRFASDIVSTLKLFGTDSTHIGILASVAVTNGDYLRLDTSVPNNGPSGGNNAQAAFPNGRRLADDTIDTILTIINNGSPLGDNVNSSDVLPISAFPYLAPPHQPLPSGTIDDSTRN